jgi:hypothetical protein
MGQEEGRARGGDPAALAAAVCFGWLALGLRRGAVAAEDVLRDRAAGSRVGAASRPVRALTPCTRARGRIPPLALRQGPKLGPPPTTLLDKVRDPIDFVGRIVYTKIGGINR